MERTASALPSHKIHLQPAVVPTSAAAVSPDGVSAAVAIIRLSSFRGTYQISP